MTLSIFLKVLCLKKTTKMILKYMAELSVSPETVLSFR